MFSVVVAVVALLTAPLAARAADDEDQYRRALEMARTGHHEEALPILRRLYEAHPEQRNYLHDYVVVLGWAEHDNEVLALQPRINFEQAPVFVIDTFGKSARNVRDFPLAVHYYRLAVERDPGDLQSNLGLALSLSDDGKYSEAETIFSRLAEEHPEQIDVLTGLADVYQAEKRPFDAFVAYDRILRIDSQNRDAQRQRILLAAELGAPDQALRLARNHPDLISEEELQEILRQQAAQFVRWGDLYHPDNRYSDTDTAIRLLQQQLDLLRKNGLQSSPVYDNARFDLMTALRDRQSMPEVIVIYRELVAENVAIPDYAMLAAGDAFMAQHQPEKARDIYLQILEHQPDDFDAQMALFYAYFDCGDYSEALALIDRMAGDASDSERRLQTASRAALARAWTGQLAEAQRRYETLLEQAPNNPYLHAGLGYVYLWRGWPRRAKDEFRLGQSIEPAVIDAHIGEIDTQIVRYDYREAESGLDRLTQRYPDDGQVRRLEREWEVHNMRELLVQVSRSTSTATQIATSDLGLDAWLYSRPLKDTYRVFGHTHYAKSRFPEGTGIYRRLGAGIEYRVRDYELVAELSSGYERDAGIGLRLGGTFLANDHWTLGARIDSYSNDVPLRGRLNEDIDGWSIGANADYSFHESRSLSLALQRLEFSDHNRRGQVSAVGFQRLVNRPVYKLDGRLGFYWSSNTRDNAPYYNPANDLSSEISLTNEWLVFRRYSRSFVHRLGVSIGNYRQSGFGVNGTWGINYEHEWNLDDRTYLLYGIARSRPVYDGTSETSMRYYLTLDWRF